MCQEKKGLPSLQVSNIEGIFLAMLPLLLNLKNRLSLVVGSGPVGQRKMRAILDAGGTVRLVTLDSFDVPARVEIHVEAYSETHLDGVSLVFAAGPPEVNAQVVVDAWQRGILVASASDPEAGDFILPASHRDGELLLAVSTGGAAPSVSTWLRDRLVEQIDSILPRWLELLKELRESIVSRIADADLRRELLRELADPRWLARLGIATLDEVRNEMRSLVDDRVKR
jgi:precorrin-2 dehydrogenase/sirohydrochlorin ferrochelatase